MQSQYKKALKRRHGECLSNGNLTDLDEMILKLVASKKPRLEISLLPLESALQVNDVLANLRRILPTNLKQSDGFKFKNEMWLSQKHLKWIAEGNYTVSWYSTNNRYLLFILANGFVFLIGENSEVFRIMKMYFPYGQELQNLHQGLVLDGELIEKDTGGYVFCIIDIIAWLGSTQIQREPYPDRLNFIRASILEPRLIAVSRGLCDPNQDPFDLQLKPRWSTVSTRFLLDRLFSNQGNNAHPVGLCFTSSQFSYLEKRSRKLLKWIFPDQMYAHFRLKIRRPSTFDVSAQLFLHDLPYPFAVMQLPKQFSNCDNHTVICRIQGNRPFIDKCTHQSVRPAIHEKDSDFFESFSHPVSARELLNAVEFEELVGWQSE